MYPFSVQLHSIGRWIVLALLLAAVFKSITAGSRPFDKSDKTLGLALTIAADTMLLLGLYQWFFGPWGYKLISANGMSVVMKDSVMRFFGIEHITGMIIAIALIHIGKAQGKKSIPDKTKHRRTVVFYTIALLIILVSIPWPFRVAGAGRGWL